MSDEMAGFGISGDLGRFGARNPKRGRGRKSMSLLAIEIEAIFRRQECERLKCVAERGVSDEMLWGDPQPEDEWQTAQNAQE